MPGDETANIVVTNLTYVGDTPSSNKNKLVEVANRAKEIYTFESEAPLKAGSIIRSREFLRTSRK